MNTRARHAIRWNAVCELHLEALASEMIRGIGKEAEVQDIREDIAKLTESGGTKTQHTVTGEER